MAARLQKYKQMHCPECHSLIEDGAPACTGCGLLFVKSAAAAAVPILEVEAPKQRRAEDHNQRRRAADQSAHCQFCGGEIAARAIRCRHCSEIVNDDYYRERAQRLRTRINYASWVSYILGLGALLVFRPVGLLSIAGGLILSIIYYAIPVEPPASRRQKKSVSFWQMIKRQFRFERTQVSVPFMRHRKLVFVGTPLIAAVVGYSANVLLLQQPVDDVLKKNAAFRGMEVSAHYEYWVVPGVVVYDLKEISFRQTPIDVHTAFLEFAKSVRDKRYSRVELSYKGVTKFSIDGASFQRLGQEYAKRNFDYVLYRFPRLFHRSDGSAPPANADRDALLQFHRHWYGEDQLTQTVQNGLMAH
jgi:hypothetical protein